MLAAVFSDVFSRPFRHGLRCISCALGNCERRVSDRAGRISQSAARNVCFFVLSSGCLPIETAGEVCILHYKHALFLCILPIYLYSFLLYNSDKSGGFVFPFIGGIYIK